jgi:hypothetical protein
MNIGFAASPRKSFLNIYHKNSSFEVGKKLITFAKLGVNFQNRLSEVPFNVSQV